MLGQFTVQLAALLAPLVPPCHDAPGGGPQCLNPRSHSEPTIHPHFRLSALLAGSRTGEAWALDLSNFRAQSKHSKARRPRPARRHPFCAPSIHDIRAHSFIQHPIKRCPRPPWNDTASFIAAWLHFLEILGRATTDDARPRAAPTTMFSPSLNNGGPATATRSRRRQRPLSSDNSIQQPKAKRQRLPLTEQTFVSPSDAAPEMYEVKSNRIPMLEVMRQDGIEVAPAPKKELSVRSKKPKPGERVSKGDGSVLLVRAVSVFCRRRVSLLTRGFYLVEKHQWLLGEQAAGSAGPATQ